LADFKVDPERLQAHFLDRLAIERNGWSAIADSASTLTPSRTTGRTHVRSKVRVSRDGQPLIDSTNLTVGVPKNRGLKQPFVVSLTVDSALVMQFW